MKIQVRYHGDDLPRLQKTKIGDWIDLHAAETVELKAGESCLVSLGISVKLPEGYEAHILPRSSTFRNWGIMMPNSMGIVDNSYSGDEDIWRMPVLAIRDTIIEKGDRICQFRIVKCMEEVILEEVSFLEGENRGGFGSTGKA